MGDTDERPTCKLSAIDPERYDDGPEDLQRRADDLQWRLRNLANEDTIEIARTDAGEKLHRHARGAMYHSPQDRPSGDEHSRLFDECRYWATRSEFSLTPEFRKNQIGDGPDRATLPDIILLVYAGDVVRWNLVGVFPCIYEHSNAVIAPEDYLTTLESGGDWRPSEPDLLDVAHEDKLAVLTSRLMSTPSLIGEEWIYHDADLDVGASGTIDLVFTHERDRRYVLVAVKPNPHDRKALDRAFGELLRYRRAFTDATDPVSMDDVELAIAGPTFPDIYERIASDTDVHLVSVAVS